MPSREFDYGQAFERNLGWLTGPEQEKLRHATVAVAGLGGAGGYQAQALARLGVGNFRLADPDTFELSNRNRQLGATENTLGRSKVDVTREMIFSVNPSARVEAFKEGLRAESAGRFLEGAGVAIDGIDFFAVEDKILFFRECRLRNIPAVTSCPLGFGASLLVFLPGGMSFEDYFDLREDMGGEERIRALAFGLSPSPLCLKYMAKNALGVGSKRAASVAPGLMLVGALAAAESVKILTGKAPVRAVPHVFQIDLMTQEVRRKYYPLGMKGPWMRLKKWAAFKWLAPKSQAETAAPRKPENRFALKLVAAACLFAAAAAPAYGAEDYEGTASVTVPLPEAEAPPPAEERPVPPDASELLRRMDDVIRGSSHDMTVTLDVKTPRWQRVYRIRVMMKGIDYAFARVLEPAKAEGQGFLRVQARLWQYLPTAERTVLIPPSLMLDDFMGSDFSNDDFVKLSYLPRDYDAKIAGEENVQGQETYRLELIPKPDAPVTYGKLEVWLRSSDAAPVRWDFYNEKMAMIRTLHYSEFRAFGTREVPAVWRMVNHADPGRETTVTILDAAYDLEIADTAFTRENLEKYP